MAREQVADAEQVNAAAEQLVRSIYRFMKTRPVTVLSVRLCNLIARATISACAVAIAMGASEEEVVREMHLALAKIEAE